MFDHVKLWYSVIRNEGMAHLGLPLLEVSMLGIIHVRVAVCDAQVLQSLT